MSIIFHKQRPQINATAEG